MPKVYDISKASHESLVDWLSKKSPRQRLIIFQELLRALSDVEFKEMQKCI